MIRNSGAFLKSMGQRPEKSNIAQLELSIHRPREKDRNFHKGGRSFYFFDFDDNVAILSTPILIFHKDTGEALKVSSEQFAKQSRCIGNSGIFKDYRVEMDDDARGSFKNFRDKDLSLLERLLGKRQIFVSDLMAALGEPDFHWKGPSWSCFYHAVFNRRPVSLITARGHHPSTLKQGIRAFRDFGHLPCEPNYLSVFPVNHPETRNRLSGGLSKSVAELKQEAIRASVELAIANYGNNPHHRFGMSDDDPKNIELIVEEMARLKAHYQQMSFFIIETHNGNFIKKEIFADHTEESRLTREQQLALF